MVFDLYFPPYLLWLEAGANFWPLVKVEPPTGGTTLRRGQKSGTMEAEEVRGGETTSRRKTRNHALFGRGLFFGFGRAGEASF